MNIIIYFNSWIYLCLCFNLNKQGIPSIDSFIGGGLPIGGVCLIGQDRDNHYADIVNRCFIAEGITHKHSIYVANLNEDKESFFKV